ncbi:MAG: HAD family phosphatase [Planctomycetes bacterium]|nr:HAD family phosphatase [Planctomycetota bacterium]
MLRAIVFDFDGIIADTEPLHFQAFADVLRGEGISFGEQDYFGTYLGLNDATFLRRFSDDRTLGWTDADRARIQAAKDAAYRAKVAAGLPLLPGVRDLIGRSTGKRAMAICSGARRAEIESVLCQHNLTTRVPIIVSADDVPLSKPDPAGYRRACELVGKGVAGLSPSDVLAIEDSLLGVQAAKAAGLRTLHVTVDPHHPSTRNRSACERIADWSCDGLEQITEDILNQWFHDYR